MDAGLSITVVIGEVAELKMEHWGMKRVKGVFILIFS